MFNKLKKKKNPCRYLSNLLRIKRKKYYKTLERVKIIYFPIAIDKNNIRVIRKSSKRDVLHEDFIYHLFFNLPSKVLRLNF